MNVGELKTQLEAALRLIEGQHSDDTVGVIVDDGKGDMTTVESIDLYRYAEADKYAMVLCLTKLDDEWTGALLPVSEDAAMGLVIYSGKTIRMTIPDPEATSSADMAEIAGRALRAMNGELLDGEEVPELFTEDEDGEVTAIDLASIDLVTRLAIEHTLNAALDMAVDEARMGNLS